MLAKQPCTCGWRGCMWCSGNLLARLRYASPGLVRWHLGPRRCVLSCASMHMCLLLCLHRGWSCLVSAHLVINLNLDVIKEAAVLLAFLHSKQHICAGFVQTDVELLTAL